MIFAVWWSLLCFLSLLWDSRASSVMKENISNIYKVTSVLQNLIRTQMFQKHTREIYQWNGPKMFHKTFPVNNIQMNTENLNISMIYFLSKVFKTEKKPMCTPWNTWMPRNQLSHQLVNISTIISKLFRIHDIWA